jgi:hypothetical protein
MNYTKVESSQIAEVGFGDGVFGPETLGIKFLPNKKQQAAGEDGSVYEYGNVPRTGPETVVSWEGLMAAESIGSYFTQNIKRHPELYPCTKVEDENPTLPRHTTQATATGTTPDLFSTNKRTSTQTETLPKTNTSAILTEVPFPETALALIDTMDDDLLFTPGAVTDAQLAAGRNWYLTEAKKYDISTDKSRTELKRFARPLQKLRTGIEARAKELTGATKRKIAAIDAEKRRLVQVVGGIEDEVLAPLTAWEQGEAARKIELAVQVNVLSEHALRAHMYDIPDLIAAIKYLESFDLSTMQEYKVGAESAITASLRVLKPELERRKVAEANELELAELRRKQAERDEDDRKAEAQRQEDARVAAAAEALAAKKVEAVIEEVKQTTRQEVIAELAVSIDTAPVDDMPVTTVKSLPLAGMVETREQAFNREAVAGLMNHCYLDRQESILVLTAITKGLIPHVSITY